MIFKRGAGRGKGLTRYNTILYTNLPKKGFVITAVGGFYGFTLKRATRATQAAFVRTLLGDKTGVMPLKICFQNFAG